MQKLSAGCLLKVLWKGYGVLFCPGDPPQPPLKRGENLLKVPSVLPAGIPPHRSPLKRRESLLKVPLFKGDLGGSGTLELERWSSELGIFTFLLETSCSELESSSLELDRWRSALIRQPLREGDRTGNLY